MLTYLDFEKPIAELETRVAELKETANSSDDIDIEAEVARLEAKSSKLLKDTYTKLTPWQKAQVARHPDRPHFKDYIAGIVDDFVPLAGDRAFADDPAIIGGFGRIDGRRVMLIGQEKGDDTASRLKHNFGMAKPEGYRKAIRLMQLADRFGIPVVTLVDTPGAFPGVEAEERGQAEAIARSTEECLKLKVPMVAVIVGREFGVAHQGSDDEAAVWRLGHGPQRKPRDIDQMTRPFDIDFHEIEQVGAAGNEARSWLAGGLHGGGDIVGALIGEGPHVEPSFASMIAATILG